MQRPCGYTKLCLWEEQSSGQCGLCLEREPKRAGRSTSDRVAGADPGGLVNLESR